MQAVILAAGCGDRMRGHEGRKPKCLYTVGGRTLLAHQMDALDSRGIDAAVVVGFEQGQIRRALDGRATYIVNDRYQATNSLYSLVLARDWVDDDLLVLNADVLFHPSLAGLLVQQAGDAFLYDSGSGSDDEDMKVRLRGGRLLEMSKQLPSRLTHGENVGVIRMDRPTAQLALEVSDHLIRAGRHNDWLASAINVVARRYPLWAVDVAGKPWMEIDSPSDLDRARREVWPRIEASTQLPSPALDRGLAAPVGGVG